MKKALIILTVLAAACSSDKKTENDQGSEQVKEQIARDKARADSMMKAQKQKIENAELDTNVKMQEPTR